MSTRPYNWESVDLGQYVKVRALGPDGVSVEWTGQVRATTRVLDSDDNEQHQLVIQRNGRFLTVGTPLWELIEVREDPFPDAE